MPSTWVISYVSSQWWISHWPELQISVNQTRTCQVQLHPGKLTFPFCCYCNTMLLASPLTRGLLALFKTYFQGHKRTFNDLIWDDDVEYFAGQNVTQKGHNNISIQTLLENYLLFTFGVSPQCLKITKKCLSVYKMRLFDWLSNVVHYQTAIWPSTSIPLYRNEQK